MSFLDNLFKDSKEDYFDPDEITKSYNRVQKRFRAGKSDQRLDNEYIEIGTDSSNKDNPQRNTINQEYFLRKKSRLQAFSEDLLVQAIIRTRTNQIIQFAMPVRYSSDGNGFRVVKKGKESSQMTKHEQNVAEKLEDFIYYTGKDKKDWRDDFPTFLTKILYDFYVYDQVNIERVFETPKSNKLNHFNHVDAGTILIDNYPKSIDKPKSFVQMLNRKKVAKFNAKDLVFMTYWNQSSPKSGGYGFSPVEAAIPHIKYHMNVEQFNARFFSQGGMTRGLLLIDPGENGATSRASLDSLRRNLMPGQGINGSWKIPVIQASDAKYVNMTQSSKDMEFVNFLNYLNNIICADFNMDPVEVNFPNRGGANGRGQGNTLNEGNTTKTKMDASQHKGLSPVMKYIERIITEKILSYVDDKYEFKFTPSDEGRSERLQQELALKLKNGMSVNESRQLMGLPKIDGLPNIPGNSDNLIQYMSIQSKLNDPEANKVQQNSTAYDPNKDKAGADVESDPNKQEDQNQAIENSNDKVDNDKE